MNKITLLLLFLPAVCFGQVNAGAVYSLNAAGAQVSYISQPMRWDVKSNVGAEVMMGHGRTLVHLTYGFQYTLFEFLHPTLIWTNGLSIRTQFSEGGLGLGVGKILLSATFRVYGTTYVEDERFAGWVYKMAIKL